MRIGATKESRTPVRRIADHPACAEALARLERLKPMLEQAQKRLEMLTNRSRSEVKKLIGTSLRVMPQMDDRVFDDMARKIAETGEISDSLMNRLRFNAPVNTLESKGEDLTEEFNVVADAARSVELFKRAVAVQERSVATERKLAIAAVLDSAQAERERIARGIAEAALDLAAKLNEESTIVDGLRAQDASIPALLRPRPFPVALHSNPDVIRWLAEALEISEAAVRVRISPASTEKRSKDSLKEAIQ